MPVIIIAGLPASGKSFRSAELVNYFENRGKNVNLVSEWDLIQLAGYNKNEHFRDPQKEKLVRSSIKSEVARLLNKNDVVIVDGTNYIKGSRYEIFCVSKATRTTQCTIYCAIVKDQAWCFNESRTNKEETYDKDVFDALCMRFEEPQHNNRWDSPLFTLFPEEKIDEENIYNALYNQHALVPNLSTQNAPLNSTNFLFEMDKITQDIISQVLTAHKLGMTGSVKLANQTLLIDIPSDLNPSQLNRLRRQFLNYMKLHSSSDSSVKKIPSMFAQFLNSNYR
ncbi:protein KTI12 homolog [Wyeomyia smithii]|uniref:protein KTI12 homolog n=1 Tax=Wyeomyia smithii TaxID=174621 RepID=UPI002467CD80|nr:protein KTI12 homolog [Wyeomyia smithii]